MTHDDVQRWLNRYVEAWRSYDAASIGDLFSEDAEYRYHPWDEPIRGREEIVKGWLAPDGNVSSRDEPGTWTARYEPYAVDGDRAVVIGESAYFSEPSQSTELRRYWNNWLIRFDAQGRCREFVEYYMLRRK
jgi:ketosteroid isomerase-like protein